MFVMYTDGSSIYNVEWEVFKVLQSIEKHIKLYESEFKSIKRPSEQLGRFNMATAATNTLLVI